MHRRARRASSSVDLKLERLGGDGKVLARADDAGAGQGELLPPGRAGDGSCASARAARDTAFDAPYRLTVTAAPADARSRSASPTTRRRRRRRGGRRRARDARLAGAARRRGLVPLHRAGGQGERGVGRGPVAGARARIVDEPGAARPLDRRSRTRARRRQDATSWS